MSSKRELAASYASSGLAGASRLLGKGRSYVSPLAASVSASVSNRLDEYRGERPGLDRSPGSSRAPSIRSFSTTSTAGEERGWYFSREAREARARVAYSDERLALFPGSATLRPAATSSPSDPAVSLSISCTGYAYRLRPLEQASRSQRMFYGLAKQLAALPAVPVHLRPGGGSLSTSPSVESVTAAVGEMKLDEVKEDASKAEVFEKLLEVGGREEGEAAEDLLQTLEGDLSEEPEQIPGTAAEATPKRKAPPIPPKPEQLASSAPAAKEGAPPASTPPTPRSIAAGVAGAVKWPSPFAFEESDLPRLHANLSSRLLSFWSQKLKGRYIRLTVLPARPGDDDPLPLGMKIVQTGEAGAFDVAFSIAPSRLGGLLKDGIDYLQVKVTAELLGTEEAQEAVSMEDRKDWNRALKGAGAVAKDEVILGVGKDGGIRCISDIDDTIKHTEVLGGTRSIFRNVFVRDMHDIFVPGMAACYTSLASLGIRFHYVSNSPWELWGVVRTFLLEGGFPPGSVTLKSYTGGGSSFFSKLWEEPAQRKRAGVEVILREFPEARFIMVGDSGEQDLELYVQLAKEYPGRVLAIFIRDVTTPFRPDSHPKLDQKAKAECKPQRAMSLPSAQSSTSTSRSSTAKQDEDLMDLYATSERPSPHNTVSPRVFDTTSDPLSPNNPLSPARPPSRSGTQDQSEDEIAALDFFYARLRRAEEALPEGVVLRLFRGGHEWQSEAEEIVKTNT